MPNSRRQYLQLLDDVANPIEREFLEYVRIAVGVATIAEIERAIESAAIADALRDIGVGAGALTGVNEAIRTAYLRGGQFEAPEARITFDIRNTRAENWLRNQSSSLVTRITESQRQGIQITLESNMRLGRNPRQTALDIVGRMGSTGRRTGGIIGLSETQAEYVANAREQLLSGDKRQMRQYFNRTRRDRRFDGIVNRAIEQGRPVSTKDVDRLTGRYADRLLKTRGDAIARTESIGALNAGRDEAVLQAIDEGVISSDLMEGEWDATSDDRTRDSHLFMDGQKRMQGEPFVSSTGARMMFPGDTSLGAGPEDLLNCRCFRIQRYNFIEQAARRAA